jgi:NitT/TauT family transport system ATP-binding protein
VTEIQIDRVTRAYGTGQQTVNALGPLSIELEAGKVTAIVGPSGCGKSTLLRLVAGLDQPSTGTILVRGKPAVGGMPGVGIVFQKDLLLDWRNIIDNVLLPAEFLGLPRARMTARARELLRELGVGDFAERNAWELSGGMRQRVAIARALLCDPWLLLLDEPFSALDALTRDQMGVLLQRVQELANTTALLITHSIPEAVFLADRVLVMSPRPGTILDDIAVNLPRPRVLAMHEDPAFITIVRRVRAQFERTGVFAA